MRGDARVKYGIASLMALDCLPLRSRVDVRHSRPKVMLFPLFAHGGLSYCLPHSAGASVRRQSSLRWVTPNVPSFVGGAASAQYGSEQLNLNVRGDPRV